MYMSWYWILAVVSGLFLYNLPSVISEQTSTDLALRYNDLLLFSTLEGKLFAVDKSTGETLWSLKSKTPVISQLSSSNYLFLTDPKDGTLYMSGPQNDGIKRLPLTIPELVKISPCSSSDGLLYSGSKQDSWIAVDALTGRKLYSFSSHDGLNAMCPPNQYGGSRIIHIPTIEYRVAVLDSKSKQIKVNITYTQYGSQSYTARQSQDLLHLSSSSRGLLASINSLTGDKIWEKDFGSPVVGIYSLEKSQVLRSIPFTSLNDDTLQGMTASRALAIKNGLYSLTPTDTILQSSFFVGDHNGQMYVMNALTEEGNIQELPLDVPLIDGPHLQTDTPDHTSFQSPPTGHYPLPEDSRIKIEQLLDKWHREKQSKETRTTRDELMSSVDNVIPSSPPSPPPANGPVDVLGFSLSLVVIVAGTVVFSSLVASVVAVIVTKSTQAVSQSISPTPSPDNSKTGSHASWSHSQTTSSSSKGRVAGIEAIETVDEENASNRSKTSTISSSDGSGRFKNGIVCVGKISYSTNDVIGKGSHGTIVFKGSFDSRPVAVKRVIQNYFDLADREVALLRESDQHPNVIRYFCMEEDPTFRYLALELCSATLHEYVEGEKMNDVSINEKHIISESMCGVSHLHNLGIVHRDIKPQNVLLRVSFSSSACKVRALISDFGLCRKLPHGRGSFTAQSGVLGTEGWIAPEMFQDRTRVTCAVDIFAMGCVIYYVLSSGSHPFGVPLRRQANIEAGDFSLGALIGADRYTAEHLINNMISFNSKFRPSADEVLNHCLFWSKSRQLSFFQDVSDRIEKETPQSRVVQSLERGASHVIKGDWRDHIGEELRQDLRKFRSYQGTSLRDLLRAMRNKKHHYRELPETLKDSLGQIPDDYVTYFTSRFPSLLVHTYKQMEMCRNEPVFKSYYSSHHSS